MCGWHVHMQITCEQCPDVTCRENHQHRLCCKSFTWSWNETTQHCCDKFHSITSSCHSRKIVQVHADHEEFCRWHVDDMCACRWHADDIHAWGWCTHLQTMCGRCSRWSTRLQTTCGWCSGWHSGWHMSSASQISNEISLLCHPHVVRTSSARDFNPKNIST